MGKRNIKENNSCNQGSEHNNFDGKKKKSHIKIYMPIVCALVAFLILSDSLIIPNLNYYKALKLKESDNYDEAISVFSRLSDYKDCAEQINEINYDKALSLMKDKKYDEAIEIFENLGDFQDAEKQKYNCILTLYGKEKTEKIYSYNIGDVIKFGSYEQDNNKDNGKEEIEWLVLAKNGDKLLLISKYALFAKSFDSNGSEETSRDYFGDTSENYRYAPWELCTLRTYLNEDFYNDAFTKDEQSKIQKSIVDFDINPDFQQAPPGDSTTDKIFILSATEVNKYFASDEERMCIPTDYAIETGVVTYEHYKIDGKATCYWWLRTFGHTLEFEMGVFASGAISETGRNLSYSKNGVRPAMWVTV